MWLEGTNLCWMRGRRMVTRPATNQEVELITLLIARDADGS
jgi:hypothetical protein